MEQQFQIRPNITCRPTNLNLIMLFDREKGVMYELNETASSLIAILRDKPSSAREISAVLAADYDEDPSVIEAQVVEFLDDFAKSGLIE
ncbi:HPr-rel-A system PqqD family peptide chaperone [Mucilaginibacter psychrotolerans]|uniref:HPr-rel-A system PqqD family peptide chaperone n=1 Tax=Mucilaginibacter psychrotolerans TaxID=1524096 RepID=A0A4Y8S7L3_9SPHI|nr:HPr-rel-A system PqqD family peptide chaperone [Mucilaginibacter psychrotolerans]TFF34575.1 HPr-rel-A system PqqD family peptide chaperone [Mucilaginibacter psychrotolerans]